VLDPKRLAQNFDEVVACLKRRGGSLDLGPVTALIQERKTLIVAVEGLRAKQNATNETVKAKAKTDPGAIEALRGRDARHQPGGQAEG
jgi:seryl-tRNA synthetase